MKLPQNEATRFAVLFVGLALFFTLFDTPLGKTMAFLHIVKTPSWVPQDMLKDISSGSAGQGKKVQRKTDNNNIATLKKTVIVLSKDGTPSRWVRLPELRYRQGRGLRPYQTGIGLGTDGRVFIIDADIFDSDEPKFVVKGGSVLNDDSFWILLRDKNDATRCVRLAINCDGKTEFSQWHPGENGKLGKFIPWTPSVPIKLTATRNQIRYHVNAAIPLRLLGYQEPLMAGDKLYVQIGIHFNRSKDESLAGAVARLFSLPAKGGSEVDGLMAIPVTNAEDCKPDLAYDLPRTPMPHILFTPDAQPSPAVTFPALRTYKGEKWDKERSDIRMATDGKIMRIHIFASDHDVASLVRGNGATDPKYTFMDDSFELFFCGGPNSSFYYQIMASCSGTYKFLRLFNYWNDAKLLYDKSWQESGQERVKAKIRDDGYVLDISFPVEELGLGTLHDGSKIYMQIVRNYRGQRGDNGTSMLLQLFPAYIYAQKRFCNHDRRMFKQVLITSKKN